MRVKQATSSSFGQDVPMSLPSAGAEPCGVLIKMLNSGEKPMGQSHQKESRKCFPSPGRVVQGANRTKTRFYSRCCDPDIVQITA